MKKIKNATITRVRLGRWEKMFGAQVSFVYGEGTAQNVSFCYDKIPELLEVLEVDFWEELPNMTCRVEQTNQCISKIGNFMKDNWLIL